MSKNQSVVAVDPVPEGPEHEQLEPPPRKQEDARRPAVPERPDSGGQGAQHHLIHTWFLPQPVGGAVVSMT